MPSQATPIKLFMLLSIVPVTACKKHEEPKPTATPAEYSACVLNDTSKKVCTEELLQEHTGRFSGFSCAWAECAPTEHGCPSSHELKVVTAPPTQEHCYFSTPMML